MMNSGVNLYRFPDVMRRILTRHGRLNLTASTAGENAFYLQIVLTNSGDRPFHFYLDGILEFEHLRLYDEDEKPIIGSKYFSARSAYYDTDVEVGGVIEFVIYGETREDHIGFGPEQASYPLKGQRFAVECDLFGLKSNRVWIHRFPLAVESG
jgi:hypothetical protein